MSSGLLRRLGDRLDVHCSFGHRRQGRQGVDRRVQVKKGHCTHVVLAVVVDPTFGQGRRVLGVVNAALVDADETAAAVIATDGDDGYALGEHAYDIGPLTASDLLEMKVIDKIIKEPHGGAHWDYEQSAAILKKHLLEEIRNFKKLDPKELVEKRVEKFSEMGFWIDNSAKKRKK